MFKNAFNYNLKHGFWQMIGFYLVHLLAAMAFSLLFSLLPVAACALFWDSRSYELLPMFVATVLGICSLLSMLFSYFAMQGKGKTAHKSQWVALLVFALLSGILGFLVAPLHATYLACTKAT